MSEMLFNKNVKHCTHEGFVLNEPINSMLGISNGINNAHIKVIMQRLIYNIQKLMMLDI